LRSAADSSVVIRDHKSGFCLGDRYPLNPGLSNMPARTVYTSRCGLGAPELLRLVEGISVGYGDDYAAVLEGQYVEITGIPQAATFSSTASMPMGAWQSATSPTTLHPSRSGSRGRTVA
jgi:hypothetical protein